jgi:hypothetical protein
MWVSRKPNNLEYEAMETISIPFVAKIALWGAQYLVSPHGGYSLERRSVLVQLQENYSMARLRWLATQRWRSPAAESGSDAGADAGGSQVQRFVGQPGALKRLPPLKTGDR